MNVRHVLSVVGIAAVLFTASAHAHWAMPEHIPVARLITNLTARTKENPQDASAWYSLGRAHSYAFTLKTTELAVFNGEPAPAWMQDMGGLQPKAPTPPGEAQRHLEEGVKALSRAMELDPQRAEICLSLASLLDAGQKQAGSAAVLPGVFDIEAVPEVNTLDRALESIKNKESLLTVRKALGIEVTPWGLVESRVGASAMLYRLRDTKDEELRSRYRGLLAEDWREQTKDLYFRAFTLALEKDSKRSEQPLRGVSSLVAFEAADGYVKAVNADGARVQDKVRVAACEAAMKAWNGLPPSGIITPIVLTLDDNCSLSDLLSPTTTVKFDLDATGSGATWPWLKPTTGLLVWDDSHTGKITSGRQLFGSVSWWMMFDNGYDALAALDDNRDGELHAQELAGIAVWFDRNSNGVSDKGEVTPIEQLGIAALSTRHTTTDGRAPMNPQGLTLTDGRTLPTWDWVTEPVQKPQDRTQRDQR